MTDDRFKYDPSWNVEYAQGGVIPRRPDDPIVTYDPEVDGPLIRIDYPSDRVKEILRQLGQSG